MAQAINYVLLKYSRSYSPSDPARFSNQPTSSDSQWQHFANPKLQLFLDDANPAVGGSTRSVNVKITWVPGGGLQHVQQETSVVLEDIDLSSFSPLAIAPQKNHSQSPPLKIIYRDSAVGFRYLHPRVVLPGALPTFRRFQICFTDPLLATQFVDSIRHVCPCKASLPAPLAQSRTITTAAHIVPAPETSSMPANQTGISTETFPVASQHAARMLHLTTSALMNDMPNQSLVLPTNGQAIQSNVGDAGLPLCGTRTSPPDTVVLASSHMNRSLQVSQTTGKTNGTPFPPPPSFAASSSEEPYKGGGPTNLDQSSFHPRISNPTAALFAGSSDPPSRSGNSTQRYVTSSKNTLVEANSATPNLTDSEVDTHNCNLSEKSTPPDFLKDLFNIKELCAMSMEQLEQLVGEVIREPEFLTLLEKLDAMWSVKGIITRASNELRY